MKLHRYLLLFFVFPLLLFSQNNKEYFYYYKGKKQILKIDKDYLYVSASKKVNTRFSKIQREDKNFFWEIVKIGENVSQQEYDKKVAELKKMYTYRLYYLILELKKARK